MTEQMFFRLAPSQTDVSYRTQPEGISTTPSDSSEVSSLASYRTSGIGMTDDEAISGMLRSHSTLIQVCPDTVQIFIPSLGNRDRD